MTQRDAGAMTGVARHTGAAGADRQAVAVGRLRGRTHRDPLCGRTPWASTTPSSTTRRSQRRGVRTAPRPAGVPGRAAGGCRELRTPDPPIRGLHPALDRSLNGAPRSRYRATVMAGDELVATTTIVDIKERDRLDRSDAADHARDDLSTRRRDRRDPSRDGDQLLRADAMTPRRPRSASRTYGRATRSLRS